MRRQRQGVESDAEGNAGFVLPDAAMLAGNGGDGNGNGNRQAVVGGEPVGHATAAAAASTWDIEEDHLLSYFLCGNDGNNNSLPPIDAVREDQVTDDGAAAASIWPGAADAGLGQLQQRDADMNDMDQPTTPAVQFYASTASSRHPQHSQPQQQQQQRHAANLYPFAQNTSGHNLNKVPSRTDTSSSSSSSLSSLAAALALGGGPAVMQVQQHLQARETTSTSTTSHGQPISPSHNNHVSPISPAHIISQMPNQQETMMLPPPPRFPNQPTTQPMTQNTPQPVTQNTTQPVQPHTSSHFAHVPMGFGHNPNQPQWQQQPVAPSNPNALHLHHQQQQQQHQTSPNHIDWIRQMNSIAGMAAAAAVAQQQMPPHTQSMPLLSSQQPQQQQQHASLPNVLPQHLQLAVPGMIPQHPPPQKDENTNQQYFSVGAPISNLAPNSNAQQQQIQQQQQQQQHQAILPNGNITSIRSLHSNASSITNPPLTTTTTTTHHHQPLTTTSTPTPTSQSLLLPQAESEERRQRRLARNRESARLSRRRKKEHLANLGDRVERLHAEIESVRRQHLFSMEEGLREYKRVAVEQLFATQNNNNNNNSTTEEGTSPDENNANGIEVMTNLAEILRETSPNCPVRKAAIHFQYNTLRMTLLPHYYKFLLWLTTRQSYYFLAGKESRTKTTAKSSGRVSSKQIGEEITTSSSETTTSTTSSSRQRSKSSGGGGGGVSNVMTCRAEQATRMWPLFCYELSISVDQEERFLMAHKRSQEQKNLPKNRGEIDIAAKMTSNLKTGVLYQSDIATHRNETCLFRILTPSQVSLFLRWFAENQHKCHSVAANLLAKNEKSRSVESSLSVKNESEEEGAVDKSENQGGEEEEISLNEICRRLDEALKFHRA